MDMPVFDREQRYQTMIAVSRRMLDSGLISKKDFSRIEEYLNKKYQPILRIEMT